MPIIKTQRYWNIVMYVSFVALQLGFSLGCVKAAAGQQ